MLYKRTYSSQRYVIWEGAGSMVWLISSMVGFLSLAGVFFSQEKPAAADESRKANPHSTIIFFRESHITGSGLRPSVYVDGHGAARLSNGRWFSYSVEPGKHKLESSAKHQPATVAEAAPGGTIYVQMVIVAGTWRGGGRLLQVDPEEARKIITKLKLQEKEEENKK
jgi:hypothetical protein